MIKLRWYKCDGKIAMIPLRWSYLSPPVLDKGYEYYFFRPVYKLNYFKTGLKVYDERYRVCHGFRLTKRNDYFFVDFDPFYFWRQLGQYWKLALKLLVFKNFLNFARISIDIEKVRFSLQNLNLTILGQILSISSMCWLWAMCSISWLKKVVYGWPLI